MLLLVIAAAAAAQTVTPPSPVAAAASPAPVTVAKEKKVCRVEDDVSSRIRVKKICLPQSEWDAIAKATQTDLEGSRNDRTLPPPQ